MYLRISEGTMKEVEVVECVLRLRPGVAGRPKVTEPFSLAGAP